MSGYFFALFESIGRRIENVVPADLLRDAENGRDRKMPGAVADDERLRFAHERVLANHQNLATAPQIRTHSSPSHAFARAALHEQRTETRWPIAIVYKARHAECKPAIRVEPDTFLVHGALDEMYRNTLCRILEEPRFAREVAHGLMAHDQDLEEAEAEAREILPFQRACYKVHGKYAASDWIIYTRNTSALMEDIRAVTARDAHINYNEDTAGSAEVLGITGVPTPIVCFFCGDDAAFAQRASEAPVNDDMAIIDMASGGDGGGDTRSETAQLPPPRTTVAMHTCLPAAVACDTEWLAVPSWFLTLRGSPRSARASSSNGASIAPPLTSSSSSWVNLAHDALTLETRIAQALQTMPRRPDDSLHIRALQNYIENMRQACAPLT